MRARPRLFHSTLPERLLLATTSIMEPVLTARLVLDGSVDALRLAAAGHRLVAENQVLSSRLVRRWWMPMWLVTHPQAPGPLEDLGDRNGPAPGPERLHVSLTHDAAGQAVITVKVEHLATDATGFRHLLYRLAELYTHPHLPVDGGRPSWFEPQLRPGAYTLRDVYATRGPAALVRLAAGALYRRLRLLTAGRGWRWPAPSAPTRPEKSPIDGEERIEVRTLPATLVSRLSELVHAAGGTLTDAVLAALIHQAGAMAHLGPGTRVCLQTTVDLRRHLPCSTRRRPCPSFASSPVTNLTGWSYPCLRYEPGETFLATVERVAAVTRAQKTETLGLDDWPLLAPFILLRPFGLWGRVLGRLAPALMRRIVTLPPVTNLGRLDTAHLRFLERRVVSAAILAPIMEPPFVYVAMSGCDSTLTISAGFRPYGVDSNAVVRLLDGMVKVMADTAHVRE